jgi:hypothetical protein
MDGIVTRRVGGMFRRFERCRRGLWRGFLGGRSERPRKQGVERSLPMIS